MTQVALGTSEPQLYNGGNGFARQQWGSQPFYSGDATQLRPEDQAAINELGPQGITTGTKSLNIATQLVKDVFPQQGPIVRNGAIQTKWGLYALPNPQDAAIVDRLLLATRDMILRMPIVE